MKLNCINEKQEFIRLIDFKSFELKDGEEISFLTVNLDGTKYEDLSSPRNIMDLKCTSK